jgi:hypothetical protein
MRWTEQDHDGTVTENIRDVEHLAAGDLYARIHAGLCDSCLAQGGYYRGSEKFSGGWI